MVRTRRQVAGENGSEVTNGFHKASDTEVKALNNPFSNIAIFKFLIPLFLILFMPNLTLILWYAVAKCDGSYMKMLQLWEDRSFLEGVLHMWSHVRVTSFTVSVVAGYSAFQLLLMRIVPGKIVSGPITPKGNVPKYKDNGFTIYIINLLTLAALTYALKQNGSSPSLIYDHFGDMVATLNLFSIVFCVFLQIKGLYAPSTSDHGTTGNVIFDYYWGTELYPNILGWDVKVFTNCRFGMTAWPLLCIIYTIKSYELHGFIDSIFVSTALQLVYFTKFFWWEAGYMSTIDIMLDRAGYYICWGCLCYVPSLYASVSFYQVSHPIVLGPVLATTILVAGLLAIVVNYWADWQKQHCRETNGNCLIWGKKPTVIRAKYYLESGEEKESILLVSGFWGLSRHFHYIPELALAFCWTLPALFDNFYPYSYFTFILILLIHRSFRDDDKCSKKYGKYWHEYFVKVPCRIVPFLF